LLVAHGSGDGGDAALPRFDGLNFQVFNQSNTPQFKSNTFTQMEEDSNGTLWIGSYESGLISFCDGEFSTYTSPRISKIKSLLVDNKSGMIWLGTSENGVYLFDGEDFRPILADPLSKTGVLDFEKSRSGAVWIGTSGNGLVRYQNKKYEQFTTKDGLISNAISTLLESKDGTLWIGTPDGLQSMKGEQITTYPSFEGYVINGILEDRAGTIWISTWDGLFRKRENSNKFEKLDASNGLPHANTTDLWADSKGSLWVATYWAGLCRLQDGDFLNYTPREGLSNAIPMGICQTEADKYLIGTDRGEVFQVAKNQIMPLELKTRISKNIRHIYKDRKGNTWFSHYDGLLKVSPGGEETTFQSGEELPEGMVRQVLEDQQGIIWVATFGGLVAIYPDGKLETWTTRKGLASDNLMCLAFIQNKLWIGTNGEGLQSFDLKTKQFQTFRTKDGLVSNLILNLHTAKDNTLWIACNGGLSHFTGDDFFNFSPENGLPTYTPLDFIVDETQHAWIPTNRGVLQIPLSSFESVEKNTAITELEDVKLLSRQDGMVRSEYSGPNKAFKDTKGQLWFPTIGGVAVIQPQKMTLNLESLPVYLSGFQVDGKGVDLKQNEVLLPAGSNRFAFNYTALNLSAPLKTHFYVQLKDIDEGWVDMGKQRTAIYTNLPPGDHHFLVSASNSDDFRGDQVAELRFRVKPYLYELTWFWIVLGVVTILAFYITFLVRSHQIRQRNKQLEKQVRERTIELQEKNFQIEKKNKDITASLQYAQRIQRAVMPRPELAESLLPNAMIWLEPRDIVSGDFYWVAEQNGKVVFAAADCTGHGVPGAFMSVLGCELLETIVNERGITEAGKILDQLHLGVQNSLRQGQHQIEDGMDIALCVVDFKKARLEFAGAKNPLVWIEDDEIREIKGDKHPIGGFKAYKKARQPYKTHYVPLHSRRGEPSTFFMFSDGFQDQFGGVKNRKFMKGKLKKLLYSIHEKSPKEQVYQLRKAFEDWKVRRPQTDDVLVVGFRMKDNLISHLGEAQVDEENILLLIQ
ncbi:MAG: two-component regulator propeller domain-containing protein, partial [Bacteroidota bacterium]